MSNSASSADPAFARGPRNSSGQASLKPEVIPIVVDTSIQGNRGAAPAFAIAETCGNTARMSSTPRNRPEQLGRGHRSLVKRAGLSSRLARGRSTVVHRGATVAAHHSRVHD